MSLRDFGYGEARYQHPEMHWLDLPEATDEEQEEESVPVHSPSCAFVERQTLLVVWPDGKLQEFPVSGDEKKTGDEFSLGGYTTGKVYGYILLRNPDFKHKFYTWAIDR
jgi:hypothetical protein